jgi:hypothetical protein
MRISLFPALFLAVLAGVPDSLSAPQFGVLQSFAATANDKAH